MKIRAHHLLCLRNFRGLGYNEAFVAHFNQIIQQLQTVQLVTHPDVICQACPHHQEGCRKNTALSEASVHQFDKKVLEKLKLTENTFTTLDKLKILVEEKIDLAQFRELCRGCEWFSFCENLMRS